jgi:hypothetical protein
VAGNREQIVEDESFMPLEKMEDEACVSKSLTYHPVPPPIFISINPFLDRAIHTLAISTLLSKCYASSGQKNRER